MWLLLLYRTRLPEAELVAIIESLPLGNKAKPEAAEPPPASTASVVMSEPEKRIRNLKKKLDQIAKLKDRQAKGEKIEQNQVSEQFFIHSDMCRMRKVKFSSFPCSPHYFQFVIFMSRNCILYTCVHKVVE